MLPDSFRVCEVDLQYPTKTKTVFPTMLQDIYLGCRTSEHNFEDLTKISLTPVLPITLQDSHLGYHTSEHNLECPAKAKTTTVSIGRPHPLLFSGLKIAVSGFYNDYWTHDTFRRCIEEGGGVFASEIDRNVMYLICTRRDYRQNAIKVQQAKQWKHINIVEYQWLEHMMTRPDNMLKHEQYSLHCILATKKAEKEAKKEAMKESRKEAKERAHQKVQKKARREAKNATKAVKAARKESYRTAVNNFKKGCEEFMLTMHADGYHVYHDPRGFAYDTMIAPSDVRNPANEKNCYNLKLYQSHGIPFLYACSVSYTGSTSKLKTEILAPIGSTFEQSFNSFTRYFQSITKSTWEEHTAKRDEEVKLDKGCNNAT